MVRDLQEITGQSIPTIVDFEMERCLEKCVALTPSASISKIRTNAESREFGMHKTSYSPKASSKGKTSKNGFKRYYYGNRYPTELWNQISAQRKASLLKKLSMRGVSKQSWFKLAQAAGLSIKVPGYVENLSINIPSNFGAFRSYSRGGYTLTVRNAQPTINVIGGRRILKRAIGGRIAYFKKNMQTGVFNSMDQVSRAYPGLMRVRASGGGQLV